MIASAMIATTAGTGPLLGREQEVALLASLIGGVGSKGAPLVLRGEPGIGKSRLLREAIVIAEDRGMTVVSTSGVQAEAQLPFAGLHQLLRPVRSHAVSLLAEQRQTLDAMFGLDVETEPASFRIALATLDLLGEVAAASPLLVVVDDAHWLDRATAEVLAFVARRIEADPIALLAATRDGYDSPLLEAGLPEHRLAPLDSVSATAVLAAVAPQLSVGMRDTILGQAAGNPLALNELPLTAGSNDAGTPPGVVPLTERLERAFAARLRDLPEETRLVLLVLALNDRDSTGEAVAAARLVAGQPIDLDAFEPAARAALIELDVSSVRFRHPLMRAAVRQSASVHEQRAVHHALAETLEADPDRRVWHRAALIAGVQEDIALELEAAGQRARRRGAIDVALAALRRAVELGDPSNQARRMLATAYLAYERGRPDIAGPMLRELEQLELDPLEVARARYIGELLDARALAEHSRVAGLIALAEQAGAAGDRHLHHNLLWIAAARTWWSSRPGPETRQLVVDAADRAGPPTAGDPRLLSIHAYADPYASELQDCLREAGDGGVTGATPAGYLASAAMVTGAFLDGLTFCAAAIDSARADGRLGALPRLLATQAILAVRLPDWNVAIPAAEEARRLATELGQPIWLATAETAIAMIAALRGDPAETERATARAEELALPLGATHIVALAQSGPAVSALAHGRHADALRFAERLFDPSDTAYHLHFGCFAIGDLAEAAVLAGRPEVATERLTQVESIVGDATAEWLGINLRHARAVLADDEPEAAVRFEEALGADLDHWPFWRGRTLLAYGRWLRRRRRVSDSRSPLREARNIFEGIGALGWADQARSELRASGESSRRRDPATRDELTAQELQIAQLAATGLSNREIGQRLYLSHRTISTHLYRVFPKLGITSRAELGAALASHSATR